MRPHLVRKKKDLFLKRKPECPWYMFDVNVIYEAPEEMIKREY